MKDKFIMKSGWGGGRQPPLPVVRLARIAECIGEYAGRKSAGLREKEFKTTGEGLP